MFLILPAALMQFMGDQSKPRGKDEIDLLYMLLKVSQSCICWKLQGDAGGPEGAALASCWA